MKYIPIDSLHPGDYGIDRFDIIYTRVINGKLCISDYDLEKLKELSELWLD